MIEECILIAVFVLLMIACVVIVGAISYTFYQLFEGREIHIKMDADNADESEENE